MKPTYRNALREAAAEVGACVIHPAAWRDAYTGLVALAFILLRTLMLLAFPLTVPMVALARLKAERDYRRGVRGADRDWFGS